jgi:phage baseplate assembly protein W
MTLLTQKPIGLTLPIRMGKSSYFEQSYDNLTQVASNILNLLKTRKGERIMNPLFGSNLYNVLFDEIDSGELSKTVLIETLKNDINQWIPNVTIYSLDITQDESNPNSIILNIVFYLKVDSSTTKTITIDISSLL